MRILFFIGSLRSGGKERRLIELLTYLKQKGGYEVFVVIAFNQLDYPSFQKLEINHIILNKKLDFKDPRIFFRMYSICKKIKPDLIHTWGSMQTFYMIPTSLFMRVPIINSQITSAKPSNRNEGLSGLVNTLNFRFSALVTSNSKAGLWSFGYQENMKFRVVYNGINLERFENLPGQEQIKKSTGINTRYAVVMVASFSDNKDFSKFIDISKYIGKIRDDISFLAVGSGKNLKAMQALVNRQGLENILFLGRVNNVEEVVSACEIGVLLSNKKVHGEGISNSILEYMALGKPVIANDAGGTREIVKHNHNGYLITAESVEEVADMIIELIDNYNKRNMLGQKGRKLIEEKFNLERMGLEFEKIYTELINSN